MAVATAHSTHLPPLGVHQREQVGHQPQVMLVEPVDLPSLGKQLHWTVVGPLLRPMHLQLAGLIDSWREPADAAAERAVAIGLIPDRQSTAVAAGTSLRSPGPR